MEARQNLEDARRGGKERGEARRQELRRWIEEGGMKGLGSEIGHGKSRQSDIRKKPPESEFSSSTQPEE